MSKCKSCDAEIYWVKIVPSGKMMPVDKKHTTVIQKVPAGDDWIGYTTSGHLSHFATCPNADKHRKRNNKRR